MVSHETSPYWFVLVNTVDPDDAAYNDAAYRVLHPAYADGSDAVFIMGNCSWHSIFAALGKKPTPVENDTDLLCKLNYAIRMFVDVVDGVCRSCDVKPAGLSCGKRACDAKH